MNRTDHGYNMRHVILTILIHKCMQEFVYSIFYYGKVLTRKTILLLTHLAVKVFTKKITSFINSLHKENLLYLSTKYFIMVYKWMIFHRKLRYLAIILRCSEL